MKDQIETELIEVRDLYENVSNTITELDRVSKFTRPTLCGERYYTSKEITQLFHISPRALQTYRDIRAIPFTQIGGRILYPESELVRLLESNLSK